ncbi:early nodulin-75-like isoform X3 [Takifugu rubripes]|uniref:early nodulin-75-like isoform X3 n=1 Tax=Takifugu rubripes TaxID=31033 RepID=UPI001145A1D4|nr:early nodulin-75-like isoform X3 [Takifugu rubripes]
MKFMNPSVLCGLNKMKFMAQGADAQQFSMDPGASGLPVPLPNVSPSCGYDTQWNSPSLSMVVPYNGCFMIITGGYYVLPMLWYNIQFSLWCPMSSWGQPPLLQAAATTPPPVSQPQYYPFWNVPFQMPQHVKHPPWSLPSGQMPPQVMPFPKHPPWIDPSGQMPPQVMPFPKHPPWIDPSGQMPPQVMPFPKHPPWIDPSGQMPPQVMPFPKHPPWGFPSGQMPQAMPFPNLPFWNPHFYPTMMPKTTTTPPSQTSTLPSPGGQVPFNPIQLPYPWGFPMFPPGGAFPVKTKPNQPMPPFGAGYPLPIQCSTCVSKM